MNVTYSSNILYSKLGKLFTTFNLNMKCRAIWDRCSYQQIPSLIGKLKSSEKWTESATMTAISHVRRAFMCTEIKVIIFYSANKQRHDTLQHCQRTHRKGKISAGIARGRTKWREREKGQCREPQNALKDNWVQKYGALEKLGSADTTKHIVQTSGCKAKRTQQTNPTPGTTITRTTRRTTTRRRPAVVRNRS